MASTDARDETPQVWNDRNKYMTAAMATNGDGRPHTFPLCVEVRAEPLWSGDPRPTVTPLHEQPNVKMTCELQAAGNAGERGIDTRKPVAQTFEGLVQRAVLSDFLDDVLYDVAVVHTGIARVDFNVERRRDGRELDGFPAGCLQRHRWSQP